MAKRFFIISVVVFLSYLYARFENSNITSYFVSGYRETLLETLPDGEFETLEGEKITYKEIKGDNKLMFVHFWGTWCAPCETEFPALIRLVSRFTKSEEVNFAFVAVNDDKKKVKKFLKKFDSFRDHFEVYIDNDENFKLKYGTTRVPESYLFGQNNEVLKKFSGPQDWDNNFYFRYIKSIL